MRFYFILIFVFGWLVAFPQNKTYQQELLDIKKAKIQLNTDSINTDSISSYLTNKLYYTLFPYWEGTTWDYNGYTNTPKKGEIACGYFISTTLKHLGFNWNRFKLAQMYSSAIIKNTCSEIKTYTRIDELISHMNKQPTGIYMVGLSNHVGFIIKTKNHLRFVHSNYINNEGPVSERLLNSEALSNSNVYWIGRFTNQQNIKKWLNNTLYDL